MKNAVFSPTGQCFVASNTNCLVQFLDRYLDSPDETDLDTVHQIEMGSFRVPKNRTQFGPAHFILRRTLQVTNGVFDG
jgi:hypothetical protein